MKIILSLMSVVLIHLGWIKCQSDVFKIGAGIADITGPSADVPFMGYVDSTQIGQGIHLRQFARTVIIGDGTKTIVYISLDLCMTSQLIKLEVAKRIKSKYGGAYKLDNIVIASTHTHSAPGGFLNYIFYNIPTFGFVKQVFEAIVGGILKSIDKAHQKIRDGNIYYKRGELTDASVNRSPSAYLRNPEMERAKYQYDTDKTMQLLKFTDLTGKPLAAITFFAVHATSMNKTNRLISSDNKGVASLLFEKAINPAGTLVGKGDFVALFPNGNHGDISPNTKGAFCSGTTIKCDSSPGDCGDCTLCIGSGPGNNHEESTRIIGEKQFVAAKFLFDAAETKLEGPIDYIYEAIDMSKYTLSINETTVTTCKPAIGFSMFAGTTDGPGLPIFCQGITSPFQLVLQSLFGPKNSLWTTIEPLAQHVSDVLSGCHAPKPILVPTGEMNSFAIPVQPTILPTQILRIGNILITALPAEFTTMSGRRLRETITAAVAPDIENSEVAISGVSNAYSSYVTTFEEYQAQRFLAVRLIPLVGTIEVTILWTIPDGTSPGTYIIRYFGKLTLSLLGTPSSSSPFQVTA